MLRVCASFFETASVRLLVPGSVFLLKCAHACTSNSTNKTFVEVAAPSVDLLCLCITRALLLLLLLLLMLLFLLLL